MLPPELQMADARTLTTPEPGRPWLVLLVVLGHAAVRL